MPPWPYLTLAFAFAVTPGATTALVVSHAVHGRARGYLAAAGAAAANTLQAVLALAGVSALIVAWPPGLALLRIGGAAYLIWVGARSLWRARGAASAAPTSHPVIDGFTLNALNPAITSFYVGVVPGFLPTSATAGIDTTRLLAAMYAAHVVLAFACHTLWATVFFQARQFLQQDRPRRIVDAAFGVLLIALAVRLLLR